MSTFIEYVATGTDNQFNVPFDYLAKRFVKVLLDEKEVTGGNPNDFAIDYFFLDDTTIEFRSTPVDGSKITIRRNTSATDRIVSFNDASVLTASDLSISQLQAFHIAEEAKDLLNDAISVDDDRNWDARNHRIRNVADPVEDKDAVNLQTYKRDAEGAYQSSVRASASETNAKASEDNAKQSEVNAKQSEINAKQSETVATQQAGIATTKATEASASATKAKESATKAKTSEANAKASETKAKASEGVATEQATVATTKANEAMLSASNAKASEINAKASEGKAKVSETNAKQSEVSAKASETVASTKAQEATDSATQAEGSAIASAKSAKASADSATAASTHKDTSGTHATEASKSASASASSATASAQSAKDSADSAEQSEDAKGISVTKANEASASATKAKQSSDTASAKATVATTQAGIATTKATESSASATKAKTSETNAKASEGKAKVSETNAKDSETIAVSKAQEASSSAKSAEEDAIKSESKANESADEALVAKKWAIGTLTEQPLGSSKHWAEEASKYADAASDGQLQADYTQTDSTKKDYIKNKPSLATVATTGSYTDLSKKPNLSVYATKTDLATVATTGSYDDLSNTPNLATVATTGSYNDLSNKPNLSVYATNTDVTSKLATKQDKLPTGTEGQVLTSVRGSPTWKAPKEVDVSTLIPKTGDRGVLGGYEQATVYNDGYPDITVESSDTLTILMATGMSTLTFVHPEDSSANSCKIIRLITRDDCTLNIKGATWVNNADAPTWGTAQSILILVAYFLAGGEVLLSVFHNSEG